MIVKSRFSKLLVGVFAVSLMSLGVTTAEADEVTVPDVSLRVSEQRETTQTAAIAWQERAVQYARIMSRVQWTPMADGIPGRNGHFKKGTLQTGVPYSSVKWVGRTIGFDIYLKTFLAAVENPQSVLYTESLEGKVSNAEAYYGKVCSSYTCYALQCANPYLSRLHVPPFREGAKLVQPATAESTQVGDLIFTPPKSIPGGSHIEIVTGVTKNEQGSVTHVRVEESRPRTTKNTNRTSAEFDTHLKTRNRVLCRITDFNAWRGANRAENFQFPDYHEDSATPIINRDLLLDRGDWVVYRRGEPLKFNVMDRDEVGLKRLVIKRGDQLIEEIPLAGTGIVQRTLTDAGNYTAHCVRRDGSIGQACEFSVCQFEVDVPQVEVRRDQAWDLRFTTDNMDAIIVYFRNTKNSYAQAMLFPTAEDRKRGKVTIPAGLLQDTGKTYVHVIGENTYGRLKTRQGLTVQ